MRIAAMLGLMLALLPAGGVTSAAAQCATPAGVFRDGVGWAQRISDPARIWPLTDGSGQLVAVLGTGVDQANAQFGPGQVVSGSDAADCDGRGTFAAGIVAARPNPATTFAGMAPGARILGLRYTQSTGSGAGAEGADPDALAGRIDRAVGAGASVVLVVAPATRSSPALAAAVRNALARKVVIVSPAVGDRPEAHSYPTALPGVIGVGAHDQAGTAVQAETGTLIAAPGSDLVSTSAGAKGELGHRWGVQGPAFAAAYVAGAVALVRAYRPGLDPARVSERLVRTANRSPAGGRDPRLGWGTLDVQAAVTAELPGRSEPPPATSRPASGTVAPAAAPADPPSRDRLPGLVAALAVGLAALSVLLVSVIRRGRARGWHQG
ncbi:MAG TPA: S8 family serine peptidase [Actinophytocola sp.]|uniref:S8 family serine peptidase n=1 Tax=Actinophytocola sp. TaxID=1872138 RepID=UPI002DBE9820|nr:S8 family serine peptidase [Actinophytocola sp.]HEU5472595.1 S8 family serine peptidase [Actinophytocola sp.]